MSQIFNKEHYQIISKTLNPIYREDGGGMFVDILTALCNMFKEDNPKFNIGEFLIDCGFTNKAGLN